MRILGAVYRRLVGTVSTVLPCILYFPYKWRLALKRQAPARLHVGCGENYFDGWINADLNRHADLIVFLQKRLPIPDKALVRIYLEHVLEHASYEIGVYFLREAFRTLRRGGVIRIAVPDLEDLVAGYFHDDWKRFDWVNWPGHSFIQTRAQMLNVAFRWWGHQHLYDREELARALSEAGFERVEFVERMQSKHEDLRGLETRLDSKLVVEATKT